MYLSTDPEGYAEVVYLGGLKGTDGAFNYEVPEGTDITASRAPSAGAMSSQCFSRQRPSRRAGDNHWVGLRPRQYRNRLRRRY